MGYGGIIKTVVRVASSVVGGMVCGPPCAAIGSAVATAATGGSFKESLMAGATSFIGASVSANFSSAASTNTIANSAGEIAGKNAFDAAISAGETYAVAEAAKEAAFDAAFSDAGGSLLTEAAAAISNTASPLTNAIEGGATKLSDAVFGTVKGVARTPFDVFSSAAQDTLKTLGFSAPTVTPVIFDAAGSALGAATEFTLNQALLDQSGQFDEILEQKYSPQQIAVLRNEARNALSQQAFEKFQSNTVNPFGTDDAGLAEFNKVLASGIERENVDLGPDITEQQFNTRFDTPDLGNLILQDEQNLRKSSFGSELDKTFTGDAFDPIDDDIIQSIVSERAGGARKTISNFAARGNLNPLGGRSANEFVTQQENDASNRVRQAGQAVLGGTQNTINTLGDEARTTIGGYKLGDELFNPAPFSEQRQEIIDTQQASLGDDIRGSLGSEPLFDVNKALQSGGRSQGAVSGTGSNASFLDAIAAREGSMSSGSNRRGVGTRGSGAF